MVETWKNSKKKSIKIWNFKSVQKRSWKCPNKFWTCFELFLEIKVPSAPWRVETWKNSRKIEKPFFSKWPKSFPKVFKRVFNMLRGSFFGKKTWPVHPGGSKLGTLRKKIENNLKFQRCPKTLLRVSKQVLRWFYRNFLFSAPWRVETWKKFKKLEKLSIVQNAWKNVPKSNQTCFQHASRYFFGKHFCPVHPGWSKLAKNTKKWKNCEIFKFLQKRSQKHCLSMFCLIISTEKSSAQWTLETQ